MLSGIIWSGNREREPNMHISERRRVQRRGGANPSVSTVTGSRRCRWGAKGRSHAAPSATLRLEGTSEEREIPRERGPIRGGDGEREWPTGWLTDRWTKSGCWACSFLIKGDRSWRQQQEHKNTKTPLADDTQTDQMQQEEDGWAMSLPVYERHFIRHNYHLSNNTVMTTCHWEVLPIQPRWCH